VICHCFRLFILITPGTTESEVQSVLNPVNTRIHLLRAIPIHQKNGKHEWNFGHVSLGRLRIFISSDLPFLTDVGASY